MKRDEAVREYIKTLKLNEHLTIEEIGLARESFIEGWNQHEGNSMLDKSQPVIDGLPEYDETVECENPVCVHEGKNKPLTGLYGLAGGGIGPYTVCENCGIILTKSQDAELCDSHERKPVEIKDEPSDNQAD